ncbi:MAG: type IA DNA topoisomerase, partial [Candidatus Methanomethylicota archaeon]
RRALLKIGKVRFTLRGLIIADEGYLEIYPYEKLEEEFLPDLNIGDEIDVLEIRLIESETSPPPYLSEAELLKLMDKYGIGTDATKQDHIYTNIKRGYFYIENKTCIPTPLGKSLIEALYEIVPDVVKPEVRGFMERMLSKVATGEKSANEVIDTAKKYFLNQFDILKKYEDKLAEKISPLIRESIKIAKSFTRKRRRRK